MKRLAGLSVLALIVATGSGCGWLWGEEGYFRDRSSDYLTAREAAPMQLPPDVQVRPLEPLLPVPAAVPAPTADKFEVPRPRALRGAELARTGDQPGGSVSLLDDRRFDAPERVALTRDGSGNPLLILASDFDRAWSAVGRALEDADVRVDDLNRSLGIYYINLAEGAEKPDEAPGFFARLLGGRKDAESAEAGAERYQVRLTSVAGSVQVSVEKDVDTVAPADVARRVLELIQNRLG
ncbi:outer membrane protein assembly factor BamC [Pseudomonas stutzeri]|nr:outer membrane protein assembly factor BamC [Stutzerimonas stutzeri]